MSKDSKKEKELYKKRELFEIKNNYIRYSQKVNCDELRSLEEFYSLVFERNGELPFEEKIGEKKDYTSGRYNGICIEIGAFKKIIKDKDGEDVELNLSKTHIITNDLEELYELSDKDFVISSPVTYIGRTRNSKNARNCYGLAFDLDGVGERQIADVLHQMSTRKIPTANIIVNSGNGLHLYYLFEKSISLFDNIKILLKELKYQLTNIIWNSYTSSITTKQFQGIFQGFRLPGTKTKFGTIVTAFKTDRAFYTVGELNRYIWEEKNRLSEVDIQTLETATYRSKKLSLVEAKEKYPDWYERRIVKGQKKGVWHIKRDLYDWWLKKCYSSEVKEGHRYFTLMALAMYALKCDISKEELVEDAYKLFEPMEKLTEHEDNHFTKEDIEDSLKAFLENYRTFPRKDIEKLTGILIPANKRNGLKQEKHIQKMNLIRDNITHPNGQWINRTGRPIGAKDKRQRKNKEIIIMDWREKNPNGTKYACQKETGLSKNTIKKWWN